MNCLCGYPYAEHWMEKPRPFQDYAVVRDEDFGAFVRLECKGFKCRRNSEAAKFFSKSGRYVGSAMKCPDCGLLRCIEPRTYTQRYYRALEEPGLSSQCFCGYVFAQHILEKPCPFPRYTFIRDQDYRKFIRLETKVLECRSGSRAHTSAIAKAAPYAGSFMACPECGLWRFSEPPEQEHRHYRVEQDGPAREAERG